MKKKIMSLLLCGAMVATMFAGCGSSAESSQSESTGESASAGESDYSKELTLDVYDDFANYNGEQTGWFAKIIKDKFNIKLNIIAPNVAGGGDTLYQTRTAAGDLGDLILVGTSNGRLTDLVESGLVLELSDYMKDKDVTKNYSGAIEAANKGLEGTYAMPYSVSTDPATVSGEGTEPTFGPYVRWDYYKEMGYPEVKDLNGLLDMLEEMQALARKKEGTNDIYAFSFFKDWDGNMMNNAKQPTCMYGYDELGFVLSKYDGSEDIDILADNSPYLEVLKIYYEANKRGLVDPDSTTQNYDTMSSKYSQGKILFCPWPWASKSLFNTQENTSAGKGYQMIPISNMKIFSYGATPEGNTTQAICIGSKAEDPQRIADFIDWLYSPEGVECNEQGNGAQGPKGLSWDLDDDGKPYITEFGKKALPSNDTEVPEEWGGGSWKDGVSALNFKCVSLEDPDPNAGGAKYDYTTWESYLNAAATPLDEDWSAQMGGAKTTMEYLKKNDMLGIAPGTTYSTPVEDSNISTIRGQVKATIVDNSWQMIFAESDEQFESIKASMIETAKGLGYDDCLKVDFQNAKDQNAARAEAAKEYSK
ncbi:MAG: extracellular solute-binding protein [Lachnospiraceae bacterium]|nr:extracellular solute-binding protein [Lachnospiraceae bacterium]